MDVEIVSDERAFLALQPEWDQLWSAAAGRYQDSAEFARISWQQVAGPRGDGLHCLVLRRDGVPVVIWPMTLRRRAGLRFLAPLGPGAADDTPLLVRPGAEALLGAAWEGVLGDSGADVVQLPYLVTGSPLHRLGSSTRQVVSDVPDRLPVARLRGEPDWDVYRGSSARKSLAKRLRRLARLGEVSRRELVAGRDDAEFEPVVDWVLEHRRRRGEITGRNGSWLTATGYREFLVSSLRDTARDRPLSRLFLLQLDSTPVAAVTVGTGVAVAHTQITAFDADYAAHSPGLLAFEQCGRWALEHGMDLNMGPGGEPFKAHLARDNVLPTASLQLALTRRARLAAGARQLLARTPRPDRQPR